MTTVTLIFDLTAVDVAARFGSNPEQFRQDLKRYFKEIGLVTCYFNALSSFNRVISLGAEPAVEQKLKLLGISDSPETYLDLGTQHVTKMAAIIAKESLQLASMPSKSRKTMGFEYAQQLQRGLCFIKRMRLMKTMEKMSSKTIVINFSKDLSEQTTELMTLFFTYQTFHEKIDVLDLSGKINPTLQQGCDITGGRYFPLDKYPRSLLGCIARNFSISDVNLSLFPSISESEIDYRFPCRCHNKLVDLGYICASCLSVHCRPAVKCCGCGANFVPKIDSIDELILRQPSDVLTGQKLLIKRRNDGDEEVRQRLAVLPAKKQKEKNGLPVPMSSEA
uniref:General transcription factor IIH subunit 3 n=1 Tax=Panagrolaimus sp. JU765 TaxID=591449 RepID=A0AC34QQJ2_9BILA